MSEIIDLKDTYWVAKAKEEIPFEDDYEQFIPEEELEDYVKDLEAEEEERRERVLNQYKRFKLNARSVLEYNMMQMALKELSSSFDLEAVQIEFFVWNKVEITDGGGHSIVLVRDLDCPLMWKPCEEKTE